MVATIAKSLRVEAGLGKGLASAVEKILFERKYSGRSVAIVGKSVTGWASTSLWLELCTRNDGESERVRESLLSVMPKIELLLEKGGTAPTDFTLHDNEHSFRVAEKIVLLVCDRTALQSLSSYEMALLLLGAYLHDIGMTPSQGRVTSLYDFLLTGKPGLLSLEEEEDFQLWLDSGGEVIAPPICDGNLTPQILAKARHLIVHYCRFKHNDWSEVWIRSHLQDRDLYKGWIDDLVVLCKSHHQDYVDLVDKRLDPRLVGRNGDVVHLRFLALLLRIADVLEFDPERTPEVLVEHRAVANDSLLYWWKDHQVSLRIEAGRIILSARPTSARLHRAIKEMADQINYELGLARRVADEKPLSVCAHVSQQLPHQWRWPAAANVALEPADGAYEFIDGSFRPDTKKILELFSGVRLYGDALIAVREVIQNSFDAVWKQMALERLRKKDPSAPMHEMDLGRQHGISVRFTRCGDGYQLVCTDTGIGMSKADIQDRFLVSGTTKRMFRRALERKCRRNGFRLYQTGQFGLGVLAYFMLAESITIRTRKSQDSGEGETTGWVFKTDGIGSFGELRRDSEVSRGATVVFEIRRDIIGDKPNAWFEGLREYLLKTITYTPCLFELESDVPGCRGFLVGPGWACSHDMWTATILRHVESPKVQVHKDDFHLLSRDRVQQLDRLSSLQEDLKRHATQHLRWKTTEGMLPEGAGRYRISIPFFDLDGGASLALIDMHHTKGGFQLGQVLHGLCYVPDAYVNHAWFGVSVFLSGQGFYREFEVESPVILEVDWLSVRVGTITVNRSTLTLNEKVKPVADFLQKQVRALSQEFLAQNASSAWDTLNRAILKSGGAQQPRWIKSLPSQPYVSVAWGDVTLPATAAGFYLKEGARWQGKRVSEVHPLPFWSGDDGISWVHSNYAPDFMAVNKLHYRGPHLVPLWTHTPTGPAPHHPLGTTSQFPPQWNKLCGCIMPKYGQKDVIIWNQAHPCILRLDRRAWEWAKQQFYQSSDPLPVRDQLLVDAGLASAWVVSCLHKRVGYDAKNVWEGLPDRDEDFLSSLWRLLFQGSSTEMDILFWDQSTFRLDVLSPDKWLSLSGLHKDKISDFFPRPGSEWLL